MEILTDEIIIEKLNEDVDFLKTKLGLEGDLPHFVKFYL